MKMVVASLVLFYFGGQDIIMSSPPELISCISNYDCPDGQYCYESICYDECHPDDKDCQDC